MTANSEREGIQVVDQYRVNFKRKLLQNNIKLIKVQKVNNSESNLCQLDTEKFNIFEDVSASLIQTCFGNKLLTLKYS